MTRYHEEKQTNKQTNKAPVAQAVAVGPGRVRQVHDVPPTMPG